jgi:hypothetical protein
MLGLCCATVFEGLLQGLFRVCFRVWTDLEANSGRHCLEGRRQLSASRARCVPEDQIANAITAVFAILYESVSKLII